jgi:hypothetical protein
MCTFKTHTSVATMIITCLTLCCCKATTSSSRLYGAALHANSFQAIRIAFTNQCDVPSPDVSDRMQQSSYRTFLQSMPTHQHRLGSSLLCCHQLQQLAASLGSLPEAGQAATHSTSSSLKCSRIAAAAIMLRAAAAAAVPAYSGGSWAGDVKAPASRLRRSSMLSHMLPEAL